MVHWCPGACRVPTRCLSPWAQACTGHTSWDGQSTRHHESQVWSPLGTTQGQRQKALALEQTHLGSNPDGASTSGLPGAHLVTSLSLTFRMWKIGVPRLHWVGVQSMRSDARLGAGHPGHVPEMSAERKANTDCCCFCIEPGARAGPSTLRACTRCTQPQSCRTGPASMAVSSLCPPPPGRLVPGTVPAVCSSHAPVPGAFPGSLSSKRPQHLKQQTPHTPQPPAQGAHRHLTFH